MNALNRIHDGYSKIKVPQDRIWLHNDNTDEGIQIRLDKDGTIYVSHRHCSQLKSKNMPLADFVEVVKGLVQ